MQHILRLHVRVAGEAVEAGDRLRVVADVLDRRGGAEELALATWAGRFRIALDRVGLRARLGVGATPQLARHAACWSEGIRIVTDARAFVAALPVIALEPSTDVAAVLEKCGVRRFGAFDAL